MPSSVPCAATTFNSGFICRLRSEHLQLVHVVLNEEDAPIAKSPPVVQDVVVPLHIDEPLPPPLVRSAREVPASSNQRGNQFQWPSAGPPSPHRGLPRGASAGSPDRRRARDPPKVSSR